MNAPSYQGATRAKPVQGSVFLPLLLDFTNMGKIATDLTRELNMGVIDFVQSIYIDNADNPNPAIITFTDYVSAGYRVTASAYSQGWYPVIMPKGKLGFVATTTQGVKVYTTLANCVMEYQSWGPVSVTGNFSAPVVAYIKRSTLITGASQLVMAANANRKYILLSAPSVNGNSIFVSFDGNAATADFNCYEITPGGNLPPEFATTQANIFVIGTAGDHVTAYEGQ